MASGLFLLIPDYVESVYGDNVYLFRTSSESSVLVIIKAEGFSSIGRSHLADDALNQCCSPLPSIL